MNKIYISKEEYFDKVLACWMGKNIGGTLGAPYETKKSMNKLTYYDPIPKKPAPNDDLDLQLIWLKMMEDVGLNPSLQDFANYWKRYAFAYPWNEYGFSQRNLKRGLLPPISGSFENYYIDEMGAPIRSEIWACIAPGDPQLAASMAWKDSTVDHTGGEGMFGEMFWAALESAAFVLKDPKLLITIGLAMIPISSMISRVTREVTWCFENNVSWIETRKRVLLFYGHNEPCHAPQNHAFTLIGWLFGVDFGDCLCKAVNCGYDTDCTAATLGALLGILNGFKSIPEKWINPIGQEIIIHLLTKKAHLENIPKTIADLANRISSIAYRFLKERSNNIIFSNKTVLPDNLFSLLFQNEKVIELFNLDLQTSVLNLEDLEIIVHYMGDPIIESNIDKTLGISLKRGNKKLNSDILLEVPSGWKVKVIKKPMEQQRFIIKGVNIQNINNIGVKISFPDKVYSTTFVILGPEEATGYPSGINIPRPSFRGSKEDWLKKIGIIKKSNSS